MRKMEQGRTSPALKKAQELLPFANEREKRLIKARLQEKGVIEGIKAEDRRKEADQDAR